MREKSLLINSIYNVAYKLLNALFPLISATYASHIILSSGIGKVASAQNISQYFVIIAALGIPSYGIREISKVKDNKDNLRKVFSELFLINFLSTLCCVFAYYILVLKASYFRNERILYVVVGILVVLNIINVDWFYQGVEEYGYIAKRSFVIKLVSLILLFFLVHDIDDYVQYALVNVLATAGNYLFNIVHLKKYNIHLSFHNIHTKRHLRPVIILLCTSIAIELYTLMDTTMLSVMCSEENVGYYSNSMKIVKMLIMVITAIGGVLLPRLSYYVSVGKKEECNSIISRVFSIMLFLFAPCGIGIILVADKIVPVMFGTSFLPAITTLRITALLVYALGFSNLFGTQILLTFNCEKKLFFCTILGAVSNICMNACLIPAFQQNGAAAASVVSESLVTILTFVFTLKYIRYDINKKFLLDMGLGCIVLAMGVLLVRYFIENDLASLVCSVIVGGILYLGINFLLKNPIINDLISLVRSKNKK